MFCKIVEQMFYKVAGLGHRTKGIHFSIGNIFLNARDNSPGANFVTNIIPYERTFCLFCGYDLHI